MAYTNITNPSNFQLQAFWQFGIRFLTTGMTSISGEHYRVINALEDSVITASTVHGDTLISKLLLRGEEVYGLFDSVTVSSGDVVLAIAG
jgi:hypothetical protein